MVGGQPGALIEEETGAVLVPYKRHLTPSQQYGLGHPSVGAAA